MSATPTGGRRGIVKTRITITVLHRSDNPMTDHGIDEVLYEMSEGDAVGWETGRDTAPVDPNDVGAELIARRHVLRRGRGRGPGRLEEGGSVSNYLNVFVVVTLDGEVLPYTAEDVTDAIQQHAK